MSEKSSADNSPANPPDQPTTVSDQEELHGDGASDHFDQNQATGDIKAGDTEKTGAKQPDAMGAGQA